jgi:ParB-like chromosome segregation protein Spo0J
MTVKDLKVGSRVSLKISSLVPYEHNAKDHSDAQVIELATSIQNLNWFDPILINEKKVIISGHGRLLAAIHLGWSVVPTVTVKGMSIDDQDRLRLAINRIADKGTWNMEKLTFVLSQFELKGLDSSVTGFDFASKEFTPTVMPTFKPLVIGEKQIEKAVNAQDRTGLDRPQYNDVMCPSCGHEFQTT